MLKLFVTMTLFSLLHSSGGKLPDYKEMKEEFPHIFYSPKRAVCTTWGRGHFKTFDNFMYDFYKTCNYIFVSECTEHFPDFSIQLRRESNGDIKRLLIQLYSTMVTVELGKITVNSQLNIQLPYNSNGINIQPFGNLVRLLAKQQGLDIIVVWNNEDYLMVELGDKYLNKTCGLCGDFNKSPKYKEFLYEGHVISPIYFASFYKLDDPLENCVQVGNESEEGQLPNYLAICTSLMDSVAPNCTVPESSYIQRCIQDLPQCSREQDVSCACDTFSEYARECSRLLQPVHNWRNEQLCPPRQCPTNQVYLESGSPCFPTCSNLRSTCDSHGTYGCFCPEGTVFDDVSEKNRCVHLDKCPCTWNGVIYGPGEKISSLCRNCVCSLGQWTCTTLPCPGRCSIEGGSFVTTFDSRQYRFHSICTFVLVKSPVIPGNGHIEALFESSGVKPTETSLSAIIFTSSKIKITFLKLGMVYVNNQIQGLPFIKAGFKVERKSITCVQMTTRFGLKMQIYFSPVFQVYIMVQMKFFDSTHGLCGNFNGDSKDDFKSSMEISEGIAALFVNTWRLGRCYKNAIDKHPDPCSLSQFKLDYAQRHCFKLMRKSSIFGRCHAFVDPMDYVERCRYETCNYENIQGYMCSALHSYVLACKARGIRLVNWQNDVTDCKTDYSKTFLGYSCMKLKQCPCVLNGKIHPSGEKVDALCKSCLCSVGRWDCTSEPCTGTCSVSGGSFITSFDLKRYRFHGVCKYLLVQSPKIPENGYITATFQQCGKKQSETCLTAITYTNDKLNIEISKQDMITVNNEITKLPFKTATITIYRQSSTYIQMSTMFGLEIQIQVCPVFQMHITLGNDFYDTSRGLCGNFNGDPKDDFWSSMEVLERTAAPFVNLWQVDYPCKPAVDCVPCTPVSTNWGYPPNKCYLIMDVTSIFGRCHHLVDPVPFEEKCLFEICNYVEKQDFLCAALGLYARACAAKGLILSDWRSTVQGCKIACADRQVFSYNARACDRTCVSLSDRDFECTAIDVPVDGCVCPPQTYLDVHGVCVEAADCQCMLADGNFVAPNKSITINHKIYYCQNGKLDCTGHPLVHKGACQPPKLYFSCAHGSRCQYGTTCAPTCQMIATQISCAPSTCVSGCICPEGMVLDYNDSCILPEECPCKFSDQIYQTGEKMMRDCEECICLVGKWKCTENVHCPATCVIHGEGHVTTFDGKKFIFNGNCEYTLVQDSCCANETHPNFKIVSENVICGQSGVTCSRAIKIYIEDVLIEMADGTYKVTPEAAADRFRIHINPLYLSFECVLPGGHLLQLLWNKNTNTFIRFTRMQQLSLCGLCGNFNGDIGDDFITRSQYLASNALEFANTWKEEPLCQDVTEVLHPCDLNPYRLSWAEKQCQIIHSDTFKTCHNLVYRVPYYESCVQTTCGCDIFGDCECLCGAIAVYAKACLDAGVCINWRTPDLCSAYCEYYNTHSLKNTSSELTENGGHPSRYQACMCPHSLWDFPKNNMEGCYTCPVNEYYDSKVQSCVLCDADYR
ncbi:mucin-6-like [Leucoraja erinacea]|uniref:mucin-6-like n=1 Tax=Leucoraja erinaceus TaxID=7782 RepID=UPI002456C362|nr:mucin-6-like [Leucoraja erinacea]